MGLPFKIPDRLHNDRGLGDRLLRIENGQDIAVFELDGCRITQVAADAVDIDIVSRIPGLTAILTEHRLDAVRCLAVAVNGNENAVSRLHQMCGRAALVGEDLMRLCEGMTLAIEPMINMGTHLVKTLSNNWTVVTIDGKLSSHYENTIAITENGPVILTDEN